MAKQRTGISETSKPTGLGRQACPKLAATQVEQVRQLSLFGEQEGGGFPTSDITPSLDGGVLREGSEVGVRDSGQRAEGPSWVKSVFASPPEGLYASLGKWLTTLMGQIGDSGISSLWQILPLLAVKRRTEDLEASTSVFTPRWVDAQWEALSETLPTIFVGRKRELSDSALAHLVGELGEHDLLSTELDPFSAVYQLWVGRRAREDRAQFFTPFNLCHLVTTMLAPREGEKVLDPSCGAGSFFPALLAYRRTALGLPLHARRGPLSMSHVAAYARLQRYAQEQVFGTEIDADLVRIARLNLATISGNVDHVYHLDSLAFPQQAFDVQALADIPLGCFDIIIGNPPYGQSLAISDQRLLSHYQLAFQWKREQEGDGFFSTGKLQAKVNPQTLFLERALSWLKPGGRLGMVLDRGILSNPGDEYVRAWIIKHAYVLAMVDLPRETFAHSGVSLESTALFLRKKTEEQVHADERCPPNYPLFPAEVEAVGFDRRCKTLYRRLPEGELLLNEGNPVVNDELPLVQEYYQMFQERYQRALPWVQ